MRDGHVLWFSCGIYHRLISFLLHGLSLVRLSIDVGLSSCHLAVAAVRTPWSPVMIHLGGDPQFEALGVESVSAICGDDLISRLVVVLTDGARAVRIGVRA
jgi:hypothetical protein